MLDTRFARFREVEVISLSPHIENIQMAFFKIKSLVPCVDAFGGEVLCLILTSANSGL